MALRLHIGIVVALAVGMALGYAVNPTAQSGSATPSVFHIEVSGRTDPIVRVSLASGGWMVQEAKSFDVHVTNNRAVLFRSSPDAMSIARDTGAKVPIGEQGFAVAIPQQRR